jgi:hypothetical protein
MNLVEQQCGQVWKSLHQHFNKYIQTYVILIFLGAVAKLRKAIIIFGMFVCLSVRPSIRPSTWKNWAPTGRIFIIFYLGFELSKIHREIVSLKCDDKNVYFVVLAFV